MNATAIYSKSGKGVQEASGKTSHLSRPDRAVLSAIDGRATLADVAQKVGKTFDPAFQKLIESLDKGGFIREVSAGTAAPASKGAATPAKPAASAPMDAGEDLDFTAAMSTPSKKPVPPPQAGPKPAPPPPKINVPPPPPPPSAAEKKRAEDAAKQQQDAFARAREEAERKAQAERDRVKAEAEAKMRAETETKLRAEAEAKAKAAAEAKVAAEAEAKIKAAQETAARIAAEAKARADAEAKKAREEAERARKEAEEARKKAEEEAARARKEAEEKAERARKEAEEKLRREQEEMRRKLEEERKEAERKAKEEARRLEEERRKLEEERKRREEERRKEEEERAARRKREEEEEAARRAERKKREEEEEARAEAERAARRKREEEEEARERAERKKRQEEEEARQAAEKAMRDARQRAVEREAEEEEDDEKPRKKKKKEKEPEAEPEAPRAEAPKAAGGFSDTLLADLDSFNTREETEQKEREEAERKRKEAEVRRRVEEEERKAKEEAARKEREEKERRKREEQEAKQREEEELRERQRQEEQRLKDEEEKRRKEAEERERKAKQDEQLAAKASGRTTDAFAAEAELRKRRERQLGKVHRDPKLEQEKKGWGKPIAITLFVLVAIGLGVAHVMPVGVEDYERGATEAFGQPVKIGSANLSLFTGLQIKFSNVSIGDTKIPAVRAYPEIGALTGSNKAFNRIEIEGLKLPQSDVGGVLFSKLKAESFKVERLLLTKLDLTGPLALPKGLEVELQYDGEGAVRQAVVRGPEALVVRATTKGNAAEFEASASSFTLPFASEISLSRFGAKGSATPQGLNVTEWDGSLLNGTVSGTANLRWGDSWVVNGVVTARGINAAVFAPALLSDGRAEGSGKFAMRGNEAAKLASEGRLDGSFTVSRGVLGSIDLSRAIQTGGKQATGRTQFNEMNGQATYERGQIQLRNIQLTAGQLNAGASVDISPNGALSGRIVADVKVASQTLKANLNLGGTLKEPQVRN